MSKLAWLKLPNGKVRNFTKKIITIKNNKLNSYQLISDKDKDKAGPFPCPECGKEFSRKSGLQRHQEKACQGRSLLEQVNEQAKFNYQCAKCGFKFATASSLKAHQGRNDCRMKGVACTFDHEHKPILEAFDTYEEAKAYFYDKRIDGTFNIKGSYKMREDPKSTRTLLITYQCKGSYILMKRDKEKGKTCPAEYKMYRETNRGETKYILQGCLR